MFSMKNSDLLFESIDEDRRVFFRIKPSKKEPVNIFIGSDKYYIKDICASGIGFSIRSESEELKRGKEYPFELRLPLINEVISGVVRIVHISHGIYHSTFVGLSSEDTEKIHLFVLERQKEDLREKGKKAN